MNTNKLMRLLQMSFLVGMLLTTTTCAVNPVTGKKDFMLMSEAQEIQLGKEADPQIVAEFGLYQDEAIQKFITEKGKQMGRISHRPNLQYEFKVLDSPVVNAFALPGGYVYFTRGILAHFNNEAEFAGVLGHEIGHVTARHSAKQYSKAMLAQVGLVVGMVVSPEFSQFAGVANTGLGLLFLKYGRDNESESDALGVEYSTKIQYDSKYMAGFFKTLNRLQEQAGASIPTFLSTHPDPLDRHEKVDEYSVEWQQKTKGPFNVNRDKYLRMIEGLVYGEDPRQGYVENSVFYHPELKFQFPIPANWRTVNMPSQVQIAPEDGKALMIMTLGQGSSPDEVATNAVNQYKLVNVTKENTQVNGMPAVAMTSDQVNEQDPTKTISLVSYFIQYGGRIYVFHGIASKTDFPSYKNYFLGTMKQFNQLKDASKINVQPEKITIKTVTKTMTFQQALQSFNVPATRHEEFAILNSMELGTMLEKGTSIKLTKK